MLTGWLTFLLPLKTLPSRQSWKEKFSRAAREKITQIIQAIREDELHPERLIDQLNKMFASVKKAARGTC